jgi:hypothetical protein
MRADPTYRILGPEGSGPAEANGMPVDLVTEVTVLDPHFYH